MKIGKIFFFKLLIFLLFVQISFYPQTESLQKKIEQIAKTVKGNVGVAIIGVGNNDTITFNGNEKFPMQSVYKFPLALAVLNSVDKGRLSLDQKIFIAKKDLLPATWSPLREKYPDGNVSVTLDELLKVTVAWSDNNGCDILFRLVGGTNIVNDFIHEKGVTNIEITATEEEMHKDAQVQFSNWSTPSAMAVLLCSFFHGNILSKKSTNYLMEIMAKTSTGTKRIKGLLPEGIRVAHKTGSSGRNEQGVIEALNDSGIVTLPNGDHFVIVAFISNTKEEEAVCESVIAQIAKVVWDQNISQDE